MKTVITYGTFDLLHTGHVNLLTRAKALGDRLIVGVTADSYDQARGKLNVMQTLAERIENVKKTGLADLIIVEEQEGQKLQDIQKYAVHLFAIGSDWLGRFDYLKEFCDVVYLERTKGVSSTDLRQARNLIVKMGIAGCGRIAGRFLEETKYVSGLDVTAVYGRDAEKSRQFARDHELSEHYSDYDLFLDSVQAVYIAVPHHIHHEFVRKALLKGKHVLCEKPLSLDEEQADDLFRLASENQCILLEALKTAFAPAFQQLVGIAKSGMIGSIKAVEATFTKLLPPGVGREFDPMQAGGALTELGSYPLFAISKLLGSQFLEAGFVTSRCPKTGVDVFTRVELLYPHAIATANVGIGVKREGDLCIAGTKGYIYVPAPWWKTDLFEVRFEDTRQNRKFFSKFDGDGLRYEISAFLRMIHGSSHEIYLMSRNDSLFMAGIMKRFREGMNVRELE